MSIKSAGQDVKEGRKEGKASFGDTALQAPLTPCKHGFMGPKRGGEGLTQKKLLLPVEVNDHYKTVLRTLMRYQDS